MRALLRISTSEHGSIEMKADFDQNMFKMYTINCGRTRLRYKTPLPRDEILTEILTDIHPLIYTHLDCVSSITLVEMPSNMLCLRFSHTVMTTRLVAVAVLMATCLLYCHSYAMETTDMNEEQR